MKKHFFNLALVAGVLVCIGFNAGTARADVVYLGPRVIQPSGQGVVPTVLTIQANGSESGAVKRVSGHDELFGDAKPGVNSKTILFSDLRTNAGVMNASNLGIFLDVVEPGNDNLVTIEGRNSLILTAYKDNGTVLGQFFYTGEFRNLTATPGPGGGRSDHVFGLTSVEAAQLQALIDANPDLRLGLEAALGSTAGGPEQFFFGALSNQPQSVPEPATLLLFGTGVAGIASRVRRRRKASQGA